MAAVAAPAVVVGHCSPSLSNYLLLIVAVVAAAAVSLFPGNVCLQQAQVWVAEVLIGVEVVAEAVLAAKAMAVAAVVVIAFVAGWSILAGSDAFVRSE